jgi:hypothetical protein
MNLRKIFVSISCCAAAIGLGSGKPVRAGDYPSGNETVSHPNERCAAAIPQGAETAGCDRIDGHLRVEVVPRIPDTSGLRRPGASPVAVRLDDGSGPRGHLRLPGGEAGFDPFRR